MQLASDKNFEEFLLSVGLKFKQRAGPEGQPFGNWFIEYENDDLCIQMVSDRGAESINISDKHTLVRRGFMPPGPASYNVELIVEFLRGAALTEMKLFDQKAFVCDNWSAIVGMFGPTNRETTHSRLSELAKERAKRIFSPWPPAILEFEEFLKKRGLIIEIREAPDGALGDRLMQYTSDRIEVRIASKDGWQLSISDKAGRPGVWYNIHTIRKFILPSADPKLPFAEWFAFAKTNWDSILEIFALDDADETHRRLEPLEQETQNRRQRVLEQQLAQMEQIEKLLQQRSAK
jgi:hypothetical protein